MKWQHHDGEDQTRGQDADSVRRTREQRREHRNFTEHIDQERLHILLQERREHEQAPDAVDDAGDAGEQLDSNADRAAEPHRAQFGEEQRDKQTDRHRDQHCDRRRDQRAVNRRDGTEFFCDRVPGVDEQEIQAEGPQRQPRPIDQGNDDATQNDKNSDGGRAGEMAIDSVAQLQTPQHSCAIDLGGRHGGSALQRYINHGSPPRRLHPALPLTKRASGEPLKRPAGRNTRLVFHWQWTRKRRRRAPFPDHIGLSRPACHYRP